MSNTNSFVQALNSDRCVHFLRPWLLYHEHFYIVEIYIKFPYSFIAWNHGKNFQRNQDENGQEYEPVRKN